MIGKLTGEETRIAGILDNTSKIRDMFSSFPDPLDRKYKIAVRIKKTNSTKVKVKLQKRPPKIDVIYPVEIRVLSVPSMIDYADNKENQKKLKTALESKMKENAENLIEKTQKEFKSESFLLVFIRSSFISHCQEYEEWDWTNKNYPFADINVTMDIAITGFGKQLKESDVEKVND